MNKDASGKISVPSLYDISGSANFFNKTDYGITVHRKSDDQNIMIDEVEVYFQKIKFKHLGKQGIISLNYDYVTGRFNQAGRDMSNWLIPNDDLHQITPKQFEFEGLTNNNEEAPF